MNPGTNNVQVLELDGGGVAEPYSPRNSVGPNGEPIAEYPSILVRWVGSVHVVYTWDNGQFKKTTFPGSFE